MVLVQDALAGMRKLHVPANLMDLSILENEKAGPSCCEC